MKDNKFCMICLQVMPLAYNSSFGQLFRILTDIALSMDNNWALYFRLVLYSRIENLLSIRESSSVALTHRALVV